MGDVVTALGRAVQEEDHDVMVVLPKYDVLNYDEARSSGRKEAHEAEDDVHSHGRPRGCFLQLARASVGETQASIV